MNQTDMPYRPSCWAGEIMTDGLIVVDRLNRIVALNAKAAQFLGRPSTDVIGHDLPLIQPAFTPGIMAEIHATGSPQMRELSIQWLPYTPGRPTECYFNPQGDRTEILLRDLTPKLLHEMEIASLEATMAVSRELLSHKNKELDQSLRQMERMNEQLADLDSLKSEFISNTSHELRTPLNVITGSLQLIREGLCESREEEQEYVKDALVAGQHLLKVINDVLDSAKLSAGKMTLLIDDISLAAVFDEVYSMTVSAARGKKLTLNFELDGAADLIVRADFVKVRQVLNNLVENAIKFTEEGGITVSAHPAADNLEIIQINICDTGIGIPLERQATIFERFTQIDSGATRKYSGTGLGLAITKSLVELMGGTIRVEARDRQPGTHILFELPRGMIKSRRTATTAHEVRQMDSMLPRTF